MQWNDYTATLSEQDHRRLVLALGAGLQEARKASAVATENGMVDAAREHTFTALEHLLDAAKILGPGLRPGPSAG